LPGTPEGWARAHRGIPLNSLMVLGIAFLLPFLAFSETVQKRIGWIMICTGWANTVFYVASNFSTNRGLSFGTNKFGLGDLAAVVALAPAYLFGVLSMGVLFVIALRAFRNSKLLGAPGGK
jgi:styrene-oxide isomerase